MTKSCLYWLSCCFICATEVDVLMTGSRVRGVRPTGADALVTRVEVSAEPGRGRQGPFERGRDVAGVHVPGAAADGWARPFASPAAQAGAVSTVTTSVRGAR